MDIKGRSILEEEIETAKAVKCSRKNKATSVDRAEGTEGKRYQIKLNGQHGVISSRILQAMLRPLSLTFSYKGSP